VAQGKDCGTISDGCGGTLNCGTCTGGRTCGRGGANVCAFGFTTSESNPFTTNGLSYSTIHGYQGDTFFAGGQTNTTLVRRLGTNAYATTTLSGVGVNAGFSSVFMEYGGLRAWAVGPFGTMGFYEQGTLSTTFTPIAAAAGSHMTSVWGFSFGPTWAVGQGGKALMLNSVIPTNWVSTTTGTGLFLYEVHGSAPGNVWAVGESGTAIRWNGTAWSSRHTGVGVTLRGVWVNSETDVWAVGGSTVVRYNGTSWTSVPTGTSSQLEAVFATSPTDVWVVGSAGTVLRWNGVSFTTVPSGVTANLTDVWASPGGSLWVVGSNATLIRFVP
jgi:hypothetical protein